MGPKGAASSGPYSPAPALMAIIGGSEGGATVAGGGGARPHSAGKASVVVGGSSAGTLSPVTGGSSGTSPAAISALRFLSSHDSSHGDGADLFDSAAAVEQRLRIARRPRGSRDGLEAFEFAASVKPQVAAFPRCDAATVPLAEHEGLKALLVDVVDALVFPESMPSL